jgi:LuxR family maltose regulon positive regulatory protein
LNTKSFYFSERLKAELAVLLKTPLTIVEAPAGFGKTTAVREFLDGNGIRRLWLAVPGSPSGVSEDAFWRDFCRALASRPEAADVAASLARLGPPRDCVRFEAARELFRQLRFCEPAVLVVDDFHLLPSPDFGALCEALAGEAQDGAGIPDFHIALVTRKAYPGKIERLRQMGACAVIGMESFTFGVEDVQGYCALRELDIGREWIPVLHENTYGWISCLNIHLAYFRDHGTLLLPAPGTASRKDKPSVFSETHLPPESIRILEEEIYAPLSPEIKDLLFALCPLERFTIHQADFLYGGDTRELLAELIRQNSLVDFDAGSGVGGGVYSMHELFRRFPVRLFKALPLERRRAIHRRCGDWFAREGEFLAAMQQYYETRDFEKALSVMEQDMAHNLVTENAAFFAEIFQDCPEDILARHPGAAFKHALAALAAADLPALRSRCARLEEQCAAMPESDPQTRVWRGELEMLLALAEYNDIAAMSARHVRAHELLGRPTGLYPPESTWTMGCPSVLFMFHRESGKLMENVRLLHATLPRYYQVAAWHGAGGEYLFEAESLYHAGDFTAASRACDKAESMAGEHRQVCNLLCALFLRLRLAVAAGDLPKARGRVEAMRQLIATSRDYFLLHTVELCAAWLHAATGQTDKIPAWIGADADAAKDNRMYAFARGSWFFVHAKVLLFAGRYGKVIALFEPRLKNGDFARHTLFFIQAHIYLAAAYRGLGGENAAGPGPARPQEAAGVTENAARHDAGKRALNALRLALDAALPDSLYLPFVENSRHILPLLRALRRDRRREEVKRILALAETWGLRPRTTPSVPPPLNPLEMTLVRQASEGKSFKEIATKRGRSPLTVKRQFAALYKRFEVHGIKELLDRLAERGVLAPDRSL